MIVSAVYVSWCPFLRNMSTDRTQNNGHFGLLVSLHSHITMFLANMPHLLFMAAYVLQTTVPLFTLVSFQYLQRNSFTAWCMYHYVAVTNSWEWECSNATTFLLSPAWERSNSQYKVSVKSKIETILPMRTAWETQLLVVHVHVVQKTASSCSSLVRCKSTLCSCQVSSCLLSPN